MLPARAVPVVQKAIVKKPKVKAAKKSKGKESKPAKKAKKDPNAPKRGLSAFMFFSGDNREKIKKENEGCSFGEVGKYLGEAWAKVDAKTKAKYEAMAAADKTRYEKEKAKYDKK